MSFGPIWGADYVRSPQREMRLVLGRFIGIAGPGVAAVANSGDGWSVARTGVGVYVVTLAKPAPKFFGAQAELMSASSTYSVRASAYNVAAGTFTFTVFNTTSGAAADLTTTEEVWFQIALGWSQRS